MEHTIDVHESKGMPVDKHETVIVEAFGLRKCSKLVEQVASQTLEVKQNALNVLCDEMSNPESVHGCLEAGVMPLLSQYIPDDSDDLTRRRASRALALLAVDANGRQAMLDSTILIAVQKALDDSVMEVRRNVMEALYNFSNSTMACAKALVEARYSVLAVQKAGLEVPQVQWLALKVLYSCIKDEDGLEQALDSGAVKQCVALLSSEDHRVRKEAANTLAFLCFSEVAKNMAIEGGAVQPLCALLSDKNDEVRCTAAGALVAVTVMDAGKKEIVPAGGIEPLIELLVEDSRMIKLNALKVIANAAVNPVAREQLKHHDVVLPTLKELETGEDTLVAKHATIAKDAVLWEP